jgi:hypothetical protein
MRIMTPAEIEEVAWEGRLEPLAESSGLSGPGPLPVVTLGEPAWWPAGQAMETETGKTWSPSAGGHAYTLLRLACTLHPPAEARGHYRGATLTAYLRPAHGRGRVVAHDLYPRQRTVEETGTVKVGLGPDLKFAGLADLKLLEVGAEIEYPQVYPVIQGYGLGESRAYWQFQAHSGFPLAGCQSVYAVLDAPGEAGGVRLSIELMASLETRWGPVRLGLPREAAVHLSRLVG